MNKNRPHPLRQFVALCRVTPVHLLVCLNSPAAGIGAKDKEDPEPLIAPVGLEDCPCGQRFSAILCHTQKLGERFEKDIG